MADQIENLNLGTLSLKKLQSFLAVAEHKSFRKAGESLNRSQPAVSVQIDSLEKDLGVKLFKRTTRNVSLTHEGTMFHTHVATALSEISAGLRKVSRPLHQNTDAIRICCAPTISSHLLANILLQFRQRYPDVDIELHEAVLDAMQNDLQKGHVELGLGPEFSEDSAFIQDYVFTDEIVAVLPANNLFRGTGSIALADLATQPLLVSGPATALWKIIENAFRSIGVTPNVSYEVVHNESLIAMVRAGLGITFLPRYFAVANCRDDYIIRGIKGPSLSRKVCLIAKADGTPSEAVKNFKALVLEQMPQALADILAMRG